MGLLDGILGQLEGSGEGQAVIANLAAKVGLSPEQAESAIGALASAHTQPGDTVQTASANTGLPPDLLQQMLGHLGGEGALAAIAGRMLGGNGQAPAEGQQGGLGGMLEGMAADYFRKS